jgi:hypothetical protein
MSRKNIKASLRSISAISRIRAWLRPFAHPWAALVFIALGSFTGCPGSESSECCSDGGQQQANSDGDAGAGGFADAGNSDFCVFDSETPLGDFLLSNTFSIVDTSEVDAQFIALAAVSSGETNHTLYGLNGTTKQVRQLGAWPSLAFDEPYFDVVRSEDDADSVFASRYLTTDGQYLVAGYTLPYDPNTGSAPGYIAVHNMLEDADPLYVRHIRADNNYHTGILNSLLLVNGSSIDESGTSNGIYGWDLSTELSRGHIATFPASAAASGFIAVSTGDTVGLGFYDSSFTNQMRLLEKSTLLSAVEDTAAIDLDAEMAAAPGGFLMASHMGTDLIFSLGFYDDSFQLVQGDVVKVSMTTETRNGELRVLPSQAEPILSVPADSCQTVSLIEPIGEDLLIGISDHQVDRIRLVRVRSN